MNFKDGLKAVGLLFGLMLWPFAAGGLLILKIYQSQSGRLIKTILIIPLFILTLVLGSAWSAALFSFPAPPEQQPVINLTESFSSPGLAETGEDETGSQNKNRATVVRIVDGDTVEIEGGQKVRYIGIDTPETVALSAPVQCFGQEASLKNRELVLNKQVELEKDVSETDKYGRLLRYVWVDKILVNELLVRQGYAQTSSYPPDIKYQDRFIKAQQLAREEKLGLWHACDYFGQPLASPFIAWPLNQDLAQDCLIKGNISSSGEKIYHLPGCHDYDKTVISESRGEKWFCSEAQAVEAGWRRAKNCP
jgi:micrococcal nuclease